MAPIDQRFLQEKQHEGREGPYGLKGKQHKHHTGKFLIKILVSLFILAASWLLCLVLHFLETACYSNSSVFILGFTGDKV